MWNAVVRRTFPTIAAKGDARHGLPAAGVIRAASGSLILASLRGILALKYLANT